MTLIDRAKPVFKRAGIVVVIAALLLAVILPSGPPADAQTIITTITVGRYPAGVAVNPLTNRIYVTNQNSHDISVIDGTSHSVITTFPFGREVTGIGINPRTNRLYAGYSSPISILDASSGVNLGTINESLYNDYEIAINSRTNRIYLADWTALVGQPDRVRIYDGNTNTEITHLNLGVSPNLERIVLAVNETTNIIYAAYSWNNNVYFIDGASNSIVRTVHVTDVPYYYPDIAVNSVTNRVYVKETSQVTVLDGATGDVRGAMAGWWNVDVNSAGNRIYLWVNNQLKIVDGATLGVLYSIQTPYYVTSVAVNPVTNLVYLVHKWNDKVSVLNDDLLIPPTATPTLTRTPTRTRTPTPTLTPFPTPIGGWPAKLWLPVIMAGG